MSYTEHGHWERDLSKLPEDKRDELEKLEERIERLDRKGKTRSEKRQQAFLDLSKLKQKLDSKFSGWRRSRF